MSRHQSGWHPPRRLRLSLQQAFIQILMALQVTEESTSEWMASSEKAASKSAASVHTNPYGTAGHRGVDIRVDGILREGWV